MDSNICTRARCRACSKNVRIRKSGHFFVHGPPESRCPMSDCVPNSDFSQLPQAPSTVTNDVQVEGSSSRLLSIIQLAKGRMLRFVPHGARVQWALTLTECIQYIDRLAASFVGPFVMFEATRQRRSQPQGVPC